jgi:hypothetical protein
MTLMASLPYICSLHQTHISPHGIDFAVTSLRSKVFNLLRQPPGYDELLIIFLACYPNRIRTLSVKFIWRVSRTEASLHGVDTCKQGRRVFQDGGVGGFGGHRGGNDLGSWHNADQQQRDMRRTGAAAGRRHVLKAEMAGDFILE